MWFNFKRLLISGRLAPEIPDEDSICGEEGQRSQNSREHSVPLSGATGPPRERPTRAGLYAGP